MADYNTHKLNGATQRGNAIDDALNALIDSLKEDCKVGDYKHSAQSADHGRWLLCDGSEVSRTTYADLFSLIGTNFGIGDGSTTFNLPNAAGKGIIVMDSGDADFNALGDSGGEKEHTLTTDEMPSHTHTSGKDINTGGDSYGHGSWYSDRWDSDGQNTGATGGGSAHNNLQPYLVVGNLFISFR